MKSPRGVSQFIASALTVSGLLGLAGQARGEDQAVTPSQQITAGTLEALGSLTETRSGFLSWGFNPPPEPEAPARFSVKVAPALGVAQVIEVYLTPPPEPDTPPVLSLIVQPPPDPEHPAGFFIQVFDSTGAMRFAGLDAAGQPQEFCTTAPHE